MSSGKYGETSEERGIRKESANGASYTSLGQSEAPPQEEASLSSHKG
ncbi:MAG TPA: hypothetical protein PLA90_16435 [Candidatus Sumerlaeota bacterium]|nr:hypothetical protein [Candidatus Sumerlaeota bacterium]